MEHRTPGDTRMPPGSVPGAGDSTLLMLDALLTLVALGKAEAGQAFDALPDWLSLSLYRLPAMLLTWISFGALVACSVFVMTDNLIVSAGSFFLLQLGLTLLLQRRSRHLHALMHFPETRKGFTALRASLKERVERDAG